ncbi:MAG: response regulator [Lewinellaceae bacterium]|nr:response regulator [Saprospiraceae bacterium]MCB9339510.1 response regulator [Lewinellaceae bacterium]
MDKINILIVEDDPIIAADLQDRLEDMGYRILGPVAAGENALAFFNQDPLPDLVIMDVQLEGEWDGIETTRHIRMQHDLPIIFLTSNSDDKTFNEAKQVNPQAFLSKPFRGRDLKHAIELSISRSASKAEAPSGEAAADNAFLLKDRLFIKVKDRMVRVFFKDILWVEADDYYCKVVTREKEFLVTQTLKKFGEELEGIPTIIRVHRSYIVNLSHVEEIGDLYLHIGKQQIPFTRAVREEVLSRLQNI